jgi:hypothetical protein
MQLRPTFSHNCKSNNITCSVKITSVFAVTVRQLLRLLLAARSLNKFGSGVRDMARVISGAMAMGLKCWYS